ncbi:RNA-binding protein 4.1-like isoform X1 [Polypterus senegalus]
MVKLFVGNLAQATTSDDLRSLFSQYGRVTECDIVKNFGFVHMEDKESAEEAIRNLHKYELNGQPMNVEIGLSKAKAATKLHVGNISSSCTNQELRDKFEEYGPVVECDIVRHYAFVHMENPDDAMEAIKGLHNTDFQGKLMSVQLSTSRLRIAPGMGEKTGCYVCGKEGHWSKECPTSKNGSYSEGPMRPEGSGFGGVRYNAGGGRGFGRDLSGGPGFSGGSSYNGGPGLGMGMGMGFGSGPVMNRGMGYNSPIGYGRNSPYDGNSSFSVNKGFSVQMGYGNPGIKGYTESPSGLEDRNQSNVIDFYEKYRARPYGITPFEERKASSLPSSASAQSSSLLRDRLSSPALDPFDRRPLPTPAVPPASCYTRDRSPVRRAAPMAEGYAYERSRLSPASTLNRSTQFDMTRSRDLHADRPHFGY